MSHTRPGFPKIPANASEVERWWFTIRAKTSRQLPLESALSWPVPTWQNEQLCLAAFYYGIRRTGDPQTTIALPPIARLVASYPNARLLVFNHRQGGDLFPGLPTDGELGPVVSVPMGPDERMRQKRLLFAQYTQLLNQFTTTDPPGDYRPDFRAAFEQISEPALYAYYRALNPAFFRWLNAK